MKGFVLAAVVASLEKQYGEMFSSDLMTAMEKPTGGVYLSVADYSDNTLDHLLANAATLLGMPRETLAKVMGVHLFSELIVINPQWIKQNTNAFDLVKSHDMALNEVVRLAFPGFVAPSFTWVEISPDILELDYRSTFMPGDMAEGLISAMFMHFDEQFSIERRPTEPAVGFNQKIILKVKPNRRKLAD